MLNLRLLAFTSKNYKRSEKIANKNSFLVIVFIRLPMLITSMSVRLFLCIYSIYIQLLNSCAFFALLFHSLQLFISPSISAPEGRLLDKASLQLGLDLYLLIDRSSSVDPVHLEDAKNFVKFLLRRFAVRNGKNNQSSRSFILFIYFTEEFTKETEETLSKHQRVYLH